jgi:alcohol dehydrogenase (NADP+)
VTKFAVGDRVGVGVFVYSCGTCSLCQSGRQNYCSQVLETYAFQYPTGIGHDECANCTTNGGYSSNIVVPENFVFAVPVNIPLEYAGPLMCAGITMWTPLYEHVVEKGVTNVAIVGFGGLGQMGVKIAKAMGANVTVLSRSFDKKEQAAALGADLLAHTDEAALANAAATFELIVDTVSVHREISSLFGLLTVGGTYHCIGGVAEEVGVVPFRLIGKNIHLTGSLVGGLPATQDMLNFCSRHEILPTIEVIPAAQASAQFAAFATGDVDAKRHVIDMSTLKDLF